MIRTAVAAFVVTVPVIAYADTSINFMGDVGYEARHEDATTTNTFRAPTLDIFATQREGKFAFVGEIVVEAFGSNSFEVDADRLEVEYRPVDWLRLRMGRLRTAFGYYGDAYQNGRYFLLPVDRPRIYEGVSFDGIVPAHSVGLHADTAVSLGDDVGKLTLDAELLNGRAKSLDEVPAFADDNNAKAVNVRVRYVGAGELAGLIVGANVYVDSIPASEGTDAATGAMITVPGMRELIFAGHVAYMAHGVHMVTEAAFFDHSEHGTDADYDTLALSSELGYAIDDDLIPYGRYQRQRANRPDPYFETSGIPSADVDLVSIGTKYVASSSVAFKVEGEIDVVSHARAATFQAAFAF